MYKKLSQIQSLKSVYKMETELFLFRKLIISFVSVNIIPIGLYL